MADATISFEEMTGQPAPGAASKVIDDSGSLSFEEMAGAQPKAQAQPSLLDRIKNSATQKFVEKAGGTVANAVVDTVAHPVETAKGVGKAVVGGVGQLISLSAEGLAGIATAVTGHTFESGQQHVQALTSKIHLINTKPTNETQSDMSDLLGLIPGGIQAAGDDVYESTGSALAGAGTQALLTALTLSPSLGAKMLKGAEDVPLNIDRNVPLNPETAPGTKVSTAFDELAQTKPDAAGAVVEHVEQADKPLATKLKQRLRYNQDTKAWEPKPMTDEVKEQVGEANAQATLVEKLGKPLASEGTRAGDVSALWDDLHQSMKKSYDVMDDEPVGAHAVLDKMLQNTKDESMSRLLAQIRSKVDDIPVHFVDEVKSIKPTSPDKIVAGAYDPIKHQVEVMAGHSQTTQTVMHELAHAATVRFMRLNNDHPITQEINRLYEIAKQRSQRMDSTNKARFQSGLTGPYEHSSLHYGLTNAEEFISESLSNPKFQKFLIDSERFAGRNDRIGGIRNRIVELIQKVLGITDPKQAQLLHAVFSTTDSLMAEQARVGDVITDAVQRAWGNAYRLADKDDPFAPKMNALPFLTGKLKEYGRQLQQTFYPQGRNPGGKLAEAVIAKGIAEQMRSSSKWWHTSQERRGFWNKNQDKVREFIFGFESGKKFIDPMLDKARQAYVNWGKQIMAEDKSAGIEYDETTHYMPHLYRDPQKVEEFFNEKYGSKWTEPNFTKDRDFDLYEQAIKANFKPRFTNPEDIMLARQQASEAARTKANILRELEQHGLAVEALKGETMPKGLTQKYPSPTGKSYWVAPSAAGVLHNAFDSKTLWSEKGFVGDAFKAGMSLKNTVVPIKLAASLFHPLHVATIDNATAMVRASKELLAGTSHPVEWIKRMLHAGLYLDSISNTRGGSRILRAYQGKIGAAELTAEDRMSLQYMSEGGLIPEMSSQLMNRSVTQFKDAWQKGQARAAFHLPFAALESVQGVMFQHWIPSLKIASYLKDVQSAIKANPKLVEDSAARLQAFTALRKSVDNRYGEMAYNTLFWNRSVKDLAVLNTLSLGWQMGFLREYGGGALDLGKVRDVQGAAKAGLLDRPLFVAFYTTQALAYGGLLTWALTGKGPQSLMDYVYPRTGDKDANGKDERVSTMFYPREFVNIEKHIEQQGVASGLGHLVASKSSGLFGLVSEWATNVDSFGRQISNPDDPLYKRLEQKLAATFKEVEPITMENAGKTKIPAWTGFNKAPAYITDSPAEASIKQTYDEFHAPKETAFTKAARSADSTKLKQLYNNGDDDKFHDQLDSMQDKYKLTGSEVKRMVRGMAQGKDGMTYMWQSLSWDEQKKILDKMTPAEREKFLPLASKQHREDYENPNN